MLFIIFSLIALAKGAPESPKECFIIDQTSESFSVECKPGYGGGVTQTFHLEVYNSDVEELTANLTSFDAPSFKVSELPSGTDFVLVLYASNGEGKSKPVALVASTLLPLERTGNLIPIEVEETNRCDKPLHRVCTSLNPDDFPKQSEEVATFCRKLTSFQRCGAEHFESCSNLNEYQLRAKTIFDSGVFLEICDTDSEIYEVFSQNTKCMYETLKSIDEGDHYFCSRHMQALESETPDIRDQLENLANRAESTQDSKLRDCLNLMHDAGCFEKELSRNQCDDSAFQLVLWFIEKSGMFNAVCKEEHQPLIQEFLTLMKFKTDK